MSLATHACDVVVLLFCGTLGETSPDLLGSDESDLVVLVWQLFNLDDYKMSDIYYIYIRPTESTIISQEWQTKNRISEEMLRAAPNFADAISQFEQTLRNELNSDGKTRSFYLCTDGQCHLRQVLHPAAVRHDVTLPNLFYSFFDLKREFEIARRSTGFAMDSNPPLTPSPTEQHFNSTVSLTAMMDYLDLKLFTKHEMFGVDHVTKMGQVMKQIVSNNKFEHKLKNPDIIMDKLETGPCLNYDLVPDTCVVRARGLPWQASDHDIAKFFKGLNIPRGGAALVLNTQGRRNGEALVRFVNSEHRDLALLRHRHHMGGRYIEVYRAKGDEFLKVAAGEHLSKTTIKHHITRNAISGTSLEAIHFLSRDGDAIVRMRGLPFCATQEDIVEFFGEDIPVSSGVDGVLLVKYADGRSTGDAFVLFSNEEVLTRHMSTPLIPTVPAPVHFSMYAVPGSPHVQAPLMTVAPNHAQQQQVVNSGQIRNCIRLRGMPYSATTEDILNFLGDLSYYILPNGVHMVLNQQGRPSGDAFIQLNSADKAAQAAQDVSKGGCHKRHMGERYVEVFQCSGDEMNMVLMGGTLNRNGIQPPPGMALIQDQATSPTLPNPATALTATTPFSTPVSSNPLSPLMLQQPIDYMPPTIFQTLPRQLYPQPAYIPYPLQGSPFIPQMSLGNAAAIQQALAAGQGILPPQLATVPAATPGVQVRMQGVPYNTGVSDILTFFKGYNQQTGVYSNGTLDGSPRQMDGVHASDEKVQNEPATRPGEWTCIA